MPYKPPGAPSSFSVKFSCVSLAHKAFCDLAPSLLGGLSSDSPLPPLIQLLQDLRHHLLPPWGPQNLGLYPCRGWISLSGCMVFIPQTQSTPLLWRMWGGEFESPRVAEVPCLGSPGRSCLLTAENSLPLASPLSGELAASPPGSEQGPLQPCPSHLAVPWIM